MGTSFGDAGIHCITRHDLLRTGNSRSLLAYMAPVTVRRDSRARVNIATTMKYDVQISQRELRTAVDKYYPAAA